MSKLIDPVEITMLIFKAPDENKDIGDEIFDLNSEKSGCTMGANDAMQIIINQYEQGRYLETIQYLVEEGQCGTDE